MIFPGEHQADSPQWWANRLSKAIHDRNRGAGWSTHVLSNKAGTRPGLKLLEQWARSEPPMPAGFDQSWVEAWRNILRISRANYAELVTSSRSERIVPIGWYTAVDQDSNGDAEAEAIATHNDLRVRAGEAIDDMLNFGDGYLLAGADPENGSRAVITSESPLWTIVADDRATGRPRAGLREVIDEWTGETEYWLYRAGGEVFTARRASRNSPYEFGQPARVPGGHFPLVRLRNRQGVGEFERHIDALTRINDAIFTRIVLTKLQAHRQRALEHPIPQERDRIQADVEIDADAFIPGPDALWDLPPGVKIWESQQVDLSQARAIVEDDVKSLCAVTKTPAWVMLPGSQNQSATGADESSGGFKSLVLDRRHRVDVGLARVMSMALTVEGHEDRAKVEAIRTIWAPMDYHSLGEKAQAFSALYGKVPFDELAIDVLQKRPDDLPRLNQMRGADMLFTGGAGGG